MPPSRLCLPRLRHLHASCDDDADVAERAVSRTPPSARPYGKDPAFNPSSPLFASRVVGSEDVYYNMSQAALRSRRKHGFLGASSRASCLANLQAFLSSFRYVLVLEIQLCRSSLQHVCIRVC